MALTVKVTAMGELLREDPPVTAMLPENVPAESPVGSAVTVMAAGGVPLIQ